MKTGITAPTTSKEYQRQYRQLAKTRCRCDWRRGHIMGVAVDCPVHQALLKEVSEQF